MKPVTAQTTRQRIAAVNFDENMRSRGARTSKQDDSEEQHDKRGLGGAEHILLLILCDRKLNLCRNLRFQLLLILLRALHAAKRRQLTLHTR